MIFVLEAKLAFTKYQLHNNPLVVKEACGRSGMYMGHFFQGYFLHNGTDNYVFKWGYHLDFFFNTIVYIFIEQQTLL